MEQLDFQKILENMDKVILGKRRELEDLEDKLEKAREDLAKEVLSSSDIAGRVEPRQDLDDGFEAELEQRMIYENQIKALNEELNESEAINVQLVGENKELKFDIEASRIAFESIRKQLQSVMNTCMQFSNTNEELAKRLAEAERELETNRKLLEKSQNEDEILMKAFNTKLDAMQATINERDEEIQKLQLDNKFALDLFGLKTEATSTSSVDDSSSSIQSRNKQKMIEIVSAFREKDEQIELLKTQLKQATEDLDRNARLIEEVIITKAAEGSTGATNDDGESEPQATQLSVEDLATRLKLLESELEVKDQQLHRSEQRTYHYETIVPHFLNNMVEAIYRDINGDEEKLKSTLKSVDIEIFAESVRKISAELDSTRDLINTVEAKENQISQLISDFNLLGSKFNLVQHQCNLLQQKVAIDETESAENEISQSTSPRSPLKLPRKIPKLQDSKLDQIDTETLSGFASDDRQTETNSKETRESGDATDASRLPKPFIRTSITSVVESRRLRELESENKLLELAMKEILMSIKWSDSQCRTILIDCPALERLCQLIEARYATKLSRNSSLRTFSCLDLPEPNYLFQMITIKSELDLLRGQNEQLRADLKLQTREYFQILEETGNKIITGKDDRVVLKSDFSCQIDMKQDNVGQTSIKSPSPSTVDNNADQVESRSSLSQTDRVFVDSIEKESVWLKITQVLQADRSLEVVQRLEKCENCVKLTKLSSHLLQCIVRVEGKVTMSEEICLNRLKNLQNLVQMLEKDLELRESLLSKTLRERNSVDKQRRFLEGRLELVENQLSAHIKDCPSSGLALASSNQVASINKADWVVSLRNPTNTISLLKAIIVCLQTRLNFKDRRLEQLEAAIATQSDGSAGDDNKLINSILSERRQSH